MSKSSAASGLEGIWQMIRAEHAGEEAPEVVVKHTTLEFVQVRYQVRFNGEIIDQGRVETKQSPTQKTLLLFGTSGPNAGRTINCIYQQVGHRLRVCYGLDGVRPSDFTTKPGQNRYLAIYRRTSH